MSEEQIASLNRQIRHLTAERDALQLQVTELALKLRELDHPSDPANRSKQPTTAFDPDWYRQQYPDVDQLGMDPEEHYRWVGQRLGRPPNAGSVKKKARLLAGFWQTLR